MPKTSKIFIDTNILVYQFDYSVPTKQRRAVNIIEKCISDNSAVISSQVVQEFMDVALKKFETPLSVEDLEEVMIKILEPFCKHFPTFDFYLRAFNLLKMRNISYYDSLIIQAALDLDCSLLYSEDFQNGLQIGKLTIKNPFI